MMAAVPKGWSKQLAASADVESSAAGVANDRVQLAHNALDRARFSYLGAVDRLVRNCAVCALGNTHTKQRDADASGSGSNNRDPRMSQTGQPIYHTKSETKARFVKLEKLLLLNIETTPSGTKVLRYRHEEDERQILPQLLISERITFIMMVVVGFLAVMEVLQSVIFVKCADRVLGRLEDIAVLAANGLVSAGMIGQERLYPEEEDDSTTDNEKKWRRRKNMNQKSRPGKGDEDELVDANRGSTDWDEATRMKDGSTEAEAGVRRRGSDTPLTGSD
jgi:hypothetical protein